MKKALITGGTSGIGLSIAKALIKIDYEVILIGSNSERGNAVALEMNGDHPKSTQFIKLDLSNIGEVKRFSIQFSKEHNTLDLLANIAGIVSPKRHVTHEGFERTFAIGYLSPFVLSTQLLPLLEKSPNGRIINVAGVPSQVLKQNLDFDDLDFSKNYSGWGTTLSTVHAKTMLTKILAEKYAEKGVDVNSFHPGWVRSRLYEGQPMGIRILSKILYPLFTESSETGVFVASSQNITGITGGLFNKEKVIPLEFDSRYKERLWVESTNMVERI
jgi:retinol dehydrogenase-12